MESQMSLPVSSAAPVRRNRLSKETPASAPVMLNACSFWQRDQAALTGFLQQVQPFREETQPDVDAVLLPDDGGDYELHRVEDAAGRREHSYVPVDGNMNHRIPDEALKGDGISPWGQIDVMRLMSQQAEELYMSVEEFAKKYTGVSLSRNTQGWRWHPVLGFSKKD